MNPLRELLGESAAITALRDKVERLLQRQRDARRLPPILIQGETGSGKGLLARILHRSGPRADGPFVDVNCAAIPETLLEAEMFGFERGAFTDARRSKPGLLQTAHRGTMFLDEIGLLPEALQAKLLKVIEERNVRRLGSTRDEPVDVWILAATNEDLPSAVAARRFRADLYHRLAVLTLELPPLHRRGDDVIRIAEHFLGRACHEYGIPSRRLSGDAEAALRAYRWPGNVRELANVIERVVLLVPDETIDAASLGLPEALPPPPVKTDASSPSLDDVVRERVVDVLARTNWNISRSAALLGISRNTLRSRIERYGLRGSPAGTPTTAATPPPPPSAAAPPAAPPPTVRWERRPVTLLRASLVDGHDDAPSEAVRAFDLLLDKFQAFGARIEALSRAAVLVTFGLDTVEEAPTRAAHAAIAGQRALDRAREEGVRLPMVRMALHFAQLLVGQGAGAPQIDDDGKRAALAVLESATAAAPNEPIVVSEAAFPSLERRFDLTEVCVGDGQRTFGLGRRHGDGRFASRRHMATFVGRQRELDLLWSRFEDTRRERGQVIGIGGEAGIGKSRLLFEFRQRLAGEPIHHLAGHCQPYGAAVPYLPVLDLVRGAAGVADIDTPEVVREKVAALVTGVGLETPDAVSIVLGLLGIKEGAEAVGALEPDAVKARIVETVRGLVLKLARRRPLVLVVEDLHWIDRASEEYFTALVEHLAAAPILVVFTYRSGYRPPWIGKSYATQVSLPPLVPEDSIRVLRSALPTASVTDAMIDLIVARSEGNPFFLEELARAVHEQAHAGPSAAVPETIQGVLLGRMDRLAPDDKRLLQIAAVVGKDGRFNLVHAVADVGEEARRGAFARLTGAEFLYATGTGDDGEYSFRHALTHEVAYDSLPASDRRAFHAKLADVLESREAVGDAASVERLAYHAYHGELWERAVRYYREAGIRAAGRSAHREAVSNFERALAALGRVGIGPATAEAAIDLRFHLRNSFQPLGDFGPILDHLREAEVLASTIGDERRLARVTAYMTDYFRLMGRYNLALESGRLAIGIAARLGDLTLQLATHTYLGQVHHARGDYREAAALFMRNVEAIGPDLLRERFGFPQLLSVHSRTCLTWSLAELGEFAAGLKWAEEGLRIADSVEHPLTTTTATAGLGVLLVARGSIEAAAPVLERGLEQIRAWKMRLWLPRVASTLGLAYVRGGRVAEGLALTEEAVREAEAMKVGLARAVLRTALAEGLWRAGRSAEAEAMAHEALELTREHSERGQEAWTLRLCAEIRLASDTPGTDVAATYWRQALDIAEPRGMRPLMAHCLRGLGEAARRAGKAAEARQHFAAARALFSAIGMDADCARAEEALRAVA